MFHDGMELTEPLSQDMYYWRKTRIIDTKRKVAEFVTYIVNHTLTKVKGPLKIS